MSGATFVIVGVLVVGFFAVSYYFSTEAKLTRLLKAAPRYSIQAAPESQQIKLVGRVSYLSEPLVAPLSGRRCACYQIIVQEKRGGKNKHWVEIIRDEDRRDFMLTDETGRALIKAQDAKLLIDRDGKFTSGTFNDATPELNAFLEKFGKESTGFFGLNRTMRYYEGIIEDTEDVVVCGVARRVPDVEGAAGDYREQGTRLELEHRSEEQPLILCDKTSLLS